MPLLVKPKIVIIGAGAAGLAAATLMLENGINDILILEAENRYGGRINSVKFGDSYVDLGAQWCHGEKGNIVYDLVKNLDLLCPSKNDYCDNTYYLSDGTVIDKNITNTLSQIAFDILDDEESASQFNCTFGEYFIKRYNEEVEKKFKDNKKAVKIANILLDWWHKFYLCLDSCQSWFDMSTTGAFTYKKCDGNLTLNWKDKGYKIALDVLLKKYPDPSKALSIDDKIFLNMKVKRIIWDENNINPDGVTIECHDGSSFNADHVLVTVSLGVLKENYKNLFIPVLPEHKQKTIETMQFGTVNKIILKFPEKWWPNECKGFSLTWTEQDRKQIIKEFPYGPSIDNRSWLEDVFGFYPVDSNPNVLLGWVVGKMAGDVEQLDDEFVIKGCMYLLKKFLDGQYKIPYPDGILRSKWKSNSYFRGSYSYIGIESEKCKISAKDLEEPLLSKNGKQVVLFAGEATHSSFYSTVHGAMETGFREANRIINIYKKSAKQRYNTIIIGAGFGGLGAGKAFVNLKWNDFLILEAQNGPGGRISTITTKDYCLDMGAQFLHGKLNPLYDLASKNGLLSNVTTQEGIGIYLNENGEIIDDYLVKSVDFYIGKILMECEKFVNLPKKSNNCPHSIGEFLNEKFQNYLNNESNEKIQKIKRNLFDWHIRFQLIDNSCLDLNKLSAKNWGKYICIEDTKHYNLKYGYQSLINLIVKDLNDKIHYNTAVTLIEYNNNENLIKLTCNNGDIFYCDHLIVTPSLGVLKNSLIFKLPLPDRHLQAIRDIGFNGIGKIFLIFDNKWWKEDGFQFVWNTNTTTPILTSNNKWTRFISGFDNVFNEPNVLVGWVGGKGVEIMENLPENIVKDDCMVLLRKFIRHYENIPEPIKVIRTMWCSNNWIQGAYSHITSECDLSSTDTSTLSEPVFIDGKIRILFAGEAAHPSHYSTTHGAYESGEAQARYLVSNCTNTTPC